MKTQFVAEDAETQNATGASGSCFEPRVRRRRMRQELQVVVLSGGRGDAECGGSIRSV